jgi:hypothetical protein
MSLSLSAIMRGGAGSRSPSARGEAAGPGVAADVDQALVRLDDPSLLHGIGREFSSNQDTRESLYQNKKAGISSFALTLHSSFSTVLPEILGKSITVGV